jgi:hypothetical protein
MKGTSVALALLSLPSWSPSSAHAQISVPPYWMLTQGAAGTCVDDDVSLSGVFINVPAPLFASERGVLSAPGFPNLGFTQDSNFQGVGSFGFTVFTNAYSLPAGTPLTLTVRTYEQPGFAGRLVYLSTVTWNCTTGAIGSIYAGSPLIFADGFECGAPLCAWSDAAPLVELGSLVGAREDGDSPPTFPDLQSTSTFRE